MPWEPVLVLHFEGNVIPIALTIPDLVLSAFKAI